MSLIYLSSIFGVLAGIITIYCISSNGRHSGLKIFKPEKNLKFPTQTLS